MRTPLIVGNWKMNTDRDAARALFAEVDAAAGTARTEVGVAPPALWITDLTAAAQAARVYAQDCSAHAAGAYTGEIATAMLRSAGAAGAIVGHSERRAKHAETSAVVGAKAAALLSAGLTAIACVGETLEEREADRTRDVVTAQLRAITAAVGAATVPGGALGTALVVAYEPVWAIGTGRTASPAQAQEVHGWLRAALREAFGDAGDAIRILYGGSVTAENAATLLAEPDIDGALVGGASLKAEAFGVIIAAGSART